jgi:hypothetical protein
LRFYAVSSDAAGSSAPAVNIQVLKPGGLSVASGSVGGSSTATMLNLVSLPVSGEYTVVIDPPYGASWQGIVELVPGTPIAIDGATISPTSDQPGEPLRYTFEATAGQRIEFGMSGLAYSAPSTATTSAVVTSPTGSSVFSVSCSTSNPGCEAFKASAPATGTYVLTVTPPAASSIVSGTFALSTPVAGSLTIGGPPQVVSVARPGQTARYAFAGSSGQLLQLSWNSPSVSGATNVSVSVLKPDGGTLTSGSMANGTSNFINVPSLPASGSYTVVFDPPSGATFSASVALITR